MIDSPPAAVWPWLAQIGCGRAGFHSQDLLDNLARSSATTIAHEFQHLEVGGGTRRERLVDPAMPTRTRPP